MKKYLIYGGVALAALLIGAFVFTQFFLDHAVTAAVNQFGPSITQTKLQLKETVLSPLTGRGTLRGLVVGNPAGWSEKPLCSVGEVHVAVQPSSLLGDHVLVNEVSIDGAEFNYETKLIASNVGDLLKNLEQAAGATGRLEAAGGTPRKFAVKSFRLTNGKIHVGVAGRALVLPLPPITLTDIGTKEGGITPDQAAVVVAKRLVAGIAEASAQGAADLAKTGGAGAIEGARQVGEAIKGLFGGEKKKP